MRIVFAAGGTGGHIIPAIAVADELKERVSGLTTLFIGARYGLEGTLVPAAGYEIRYISARGVRGRGAAARARSSASIAAGFVQSLGILSRFRPDVVFGAGGYASAAVVLAAAFLRRTVVLQEQNSVPGLTNRLLARCARRIYLGFAKGADYFGKHPGLVVTGNPLRRSVLAPRRGDARAEFSLAPGRPTLLVFGGSQGARALNEAAVGYLLDHPGVQGIIQTGEQDYGRVTGLLGAEARRCFVKPYIAEIHSAYAAADVALARAGALSVSEIAAVGLPSVLVPYPYAADDHQRYNASVLADAGGAIVIEDATLNKDTLAAAVDPLFADRSKLERMRRSLESVARTDAARVIAEDLLTLVPARAGGSA